MFGADRPNFDEMASRLARANQGVKPGIRKRSYHRALKSGKDWAIHKKVMLDTQNRLAEMMWETVEDMAFKPNPFLQISGLSAWLPIPIKYGDGS